MKRDVQVLYHEVPGKVPPHGTPMPNIHKHCGGYAESVTPNIWGEWTLSPPQCGAYTLDVDNFVGLPTKTGAAVGTTRATAAGSTGAHGFSNLLSTTPSCSKVAIHHSRGCYNYTGWMPSERGPALPTYIPSLPIAQLSLESCAEACGNLPTPLPVAGVEDGTRCFCGTAANLGTKTASALIRPKGECAATACSGDPAEKECGGVGRLLAYDYTCTRPLTNCSEATFAAMCESFDNPGDCHWCSYSGTSPIASRCVLKGLVCPPPPSPSPPPPSPPPPPTPSCSSNPPFKFGKSYPAYANASMTSWGGNAVEGDDGKYHLYTSAMSYGKNNNRAMSDLIAGPCSVGTWVRNSLVIHAVVSKLIKKKRGKKKQ